MDSRPGGFSMKADQHQRATRISSWRRRSVSLLRPRPVCFRSAR